MAAVTFLRGGGVWREESERKGKQEERRKGEKGVRICKRQIAVQVEMRMKKFIYRLLSKSMKGNILNFLHEVKKMISVISAQV